MSSTPIEEHSSTIHSPWAGEKKKKTIKKKKTSFFFLPRSVRSSNLRISHFFQRERLSGWNACETAQLPHLMWELLVSQASGVPLCLPTKQSELWPCPLPSHPLQASVWVGCLLWGPRTGLRNASCPCSHFWPAEDTLGRGPLTEAEQTVPLRKTTLPLLIKWVN